MANKQAKIGLGLYGEANIYDFLGLGVGVQYNLVELNISGGQCSATQSYFLGLQGSILFADVLPNAGESATRNLIFDSSIEDWQRNGFNTNWTLFSASAYLFAGGSVYVGFDMITFLEEIDKIYFYD